ncbi:MULTISPECIES: sensor histidine kinase [unclassified Streptomyces]|uniref:sensor histidine kinase n=1 Tax=unclassified Streptomyces TaxID=2593676 RepID=UPI00381F7621
MKRRSVPAPLVDASFVAAAAVDVWISYDGEPPLVLAVTALGCAALAFRRRFPLPVFLLTLPATALMAILVAPLVALYSLAERTRDRRLLIGCGTAFAAAAAPWPLFRFLSDDQTWTFVDFIYLLATSAAPVLLGQLVLARRDLALRLAEIEEVREHERQLHAQTVLARERAQLAREMHDVVSHQVSLIAVRAGALQVAAKDRDSREAARTIRGLSVDTLDELRHMVSLLRASGGHTTELTPQPTLADLRRLVTTSGIEARLEGELPADVGATAQRAVYRTVQEALTNVRKHAPGATATIQLWQAAGEFGATVTNTPSTRPTLRLPSAHHGLIGLKERAEHLHGQFSSGPTPDGGYQARLRLPYSND